MVLLSRTERREAETRLNMWELIKAERDRRKSEGGFTCAGKWFHSDDRSLAHHSGNKDTARDQMAAGGVMTDPLRDPLTLTVISWKTMDGSFIPLTCQLTFDIVCAAKCQELNNHLAAETHRANMEASPVPGEYDFSGTGR